MSRFSLFFCLVLVAAGIPALVHSQAIDPYARLNNPLAIALIHQQDNALLHNELLVGGGWPPDPVDTNARIIAQTSGKGIITHLWCTFGDGIPDTSHIMLWVDDSLIRDEQEADFFLKPNGIFRQPLDTAACGGYNCDVQIPFQKNFRLSFKGNYLFCIATWRPLPNDVQLPSLNDSQYLSSLDQALQYYKERGPFFSTDDSLYNNARSLGPKDTLMLADIDGSGYIEDLHIKSSTLDANILQTLRLKMCWDTRQHLSVDVPLADFFGCAAGVYPINAARITVDSVEGFDCRFPMPFQRHGRLMIINTSDSTIELQSTVAFHPYPIDPKNYGYFAAQFNESHQPMYDQQLHRVAMTHGEGKYVGMFLMVPYAQDPYFMEGDPQIKIDNDWDHYIAYPGTEDYFSGGWYFMHGQTLSLPFNGCAPNWRSMYRFHILDAIDFTNSINFQFQHGANNDYTHAYYRTLSFLYLRELPFEVYQDSLPSGTFLSLSGYRYNPDSLVTITLGDTSVQVQPDTHGDFYTMVPAFQPAGAYRLKLNNVIDPDTIYILSAPSLSYFLPKTHNAFRWRDTIVIHGNGFFAGESVDLYLDTIKLTEKPIIVSDRYGFAAAFPTPLLRTSTYTVSAVGLYTGEHAQLSIPITSSIRYEFEDLPDVTHSSNDFHTDYMGWWGYAHWSESFAVYCSADHPGDTLSYLFTVPNTDNYLLSFQTTVGLRYSAYDVELDGVKVGNFNAFRNYDFGHPDVSGPMDFGQHQLTEGVHRITFRCDSTSTEAVQLLVGPDYMDLTPWELRDGVSVHQATKLALQVYPNPSRTTVHLYADHAIDMSSIRLYDLLGRAYSPAIRYTSDNESELRVSSLPKGIYLLSLRTQRGEQLISSFEVMR